MHTSLSRINLGSIAARESGLRLIGLRALNFKKIYEKNSLYFICNDVKCIFEDISFDYRLAVDNMQAVHALALLEMGTSRVENELSENIGIHGRLIAKLLGSSIEFSNALERCIDSEMLSDKYDEYSIHRLIVISRAISAGDKRQFIDNFCLLPLRQKSWSCMLNDRIYMSSGCVRNVYLRLYSEMQCIGILLRSIFSEYELDC